MALEDFKNDYTEVDPATYINADTADTRANFVNMPTAYEIYFHKDFTASHFTNFTHYIDMHLSAVGGTSLASLAGYSVGTTVDDILGQPDAFQVYLSGRLSGGADHKIEILDASDDSGDNYAIAVGTTYYLKCIRNGTTWSVEIYTGGREDTLVDTITTTGTATAFRYILAAQCLNISQTTNRDITGWMENLDLQEAAAGVSVSALLGQDERRRLYR